MALELVILQRRCSGSHQPGPARLVITSRQEAGGCLSQGLSGMLAETIQCGTIFECKSNHSGSVAIESCKSDECSACVQMTLRHKRSR